LVQQVEGSLPALSERCGAQGLFLHNQIAAVQLGMRGAVIAEGDTMTLCIRLATELLIGRYQLPASRHPHSLLAQHEKASFSQCQNILVEIGDHRSELFNQRILPICRPLIEAISHRMAYEAALDSGTVHKPLLDLYEITAIRLNGAWFAEHPELNMGVMRQQQLEEAAVTAAAPHLARYMEESEAKAYAQAPILSKEKFIKFYDSLERSDGESSSAIFGSGIEVEKEIVFARL